VDVGINGNAYLPSGTAVCAPETIAVDAGATVVWRNNDQTPHTTTADEGQWDSSVGAGSSFSRQFMTSGTYEYHCRIHAYMTGTVVVR